MDLQRNKVFVVFPIAEDGTDTVSRLCVAIYSDDETGRKHEILVLQKSGKKLKQLSLKMVKFASLGRYILVAFEEKKIILFDYLRKD